MARLINSMAVYHSTIITLLDFIGVL